ncbi:hypothetical protein F3Y22_tig00110957pilonHSYRG00001 [Hibiscus syriacus]|uniref:Uncharacterized protein n=1 Tax=Hibiscus syriacus TaxID=106335 RepID=A0A6A2ZCC0_HIBSY|nr:hypothetical protein F3Y22_tig00110957pilonHSYRG00001 [Hibiscus syriacus]
MEDFGNETDTNCLSGRFVICTVDLLLTSGLQLATPSIPGGNRLHQGSALSPYIFAVIMDDIYCATPDGVPWCMLFADDIVLVAETKSNDDVTHHKGGMAKVEGCYWSLCDKKEDRGRRNENASMDMWWTWDMTTNSAINVLRGDVCFRKMREEDYGGLDTALGDYRRMRSGVESITVDVPEERTTKAENLHSIRCGLVRSGDGGRQRVQSKQAPLRHHTVQENQEASSHPQQPNTNDKESENEDRKSLKQLINGDETGGGTTSLGRHFSEEEQQLQLVKKNHQYNNNGVKLKE